MTGTGDDGVASGTFAFVRNEAAGRWEVSIPTSAIRELRPENARLLIVEEDHVVYDPRGAPGGDPCAAGTVRLTPRR